MIESRSVTFGAAELPSSFTNVWVPSGFTWTIRSVSWLSGAVGRAAAGRGPGTTSTMVPVLAVFANGAVPVWTPTSRLRVTVVVMATLPMLPGQRARQVAVDGVGVGTANEADATPRAVSPCGRLEDPRDVEQLAAVEEERPGRVGEVGQPPLAADEDQVELAVGELELGEAGDQERLAGRRTARVVDGPERREARRSPVVLVGTPSIVLAR